MIYFFECFFSMGGSLMSLNRILWAAVFLLAIVPCASATIFTWDGGGANTDILTNENWNPDGAPALNASALEGTGQLHFPAGVPSTVTSTGTQLFALELNFDAGAATSYTIGSSTNYIEIAMRNNGSIIDNQNAATANINLSFNLGTGSSTRVATIKAGAGDIVFNGGTTGSGTGTAYFGMTSTNAASHRDFLLGKNITFESPMRLAGDTPVHVYGGAGTATSIADTTGILTLNGATGTASANNLETDFRGVVHLWSGRLRIGNNDALGRTANNTFIHGTFAASTSAVAQLSGGYEHGFGTLELYNNVTVGEAVRIDSRIGDVADTDMINNVSGSNTLSNWNLQGGAGRFNFRSTSGTLTLSSTRAIHVSDGARSDNGGPGLINSVYTFRGNGDFVATSAIAQESGFAGAIAGMEGTVSSLLRKQGAGTLTLGAATNDWDGGTWIEDGAIVVAGGGSFSTVGPRVHVDSSGAMLDLSAIGGLSMVAGKTVSGSGTVVGNITTNDPTAAISPGGTGGLDGSDLLTVAAGAGTLTLQNNLDMSAGGSMVWSLAALSTSNAGTDFDQLVVAGNLTLGGSSDLTLDFSILGGAGPGSGNPFWNSAHSWKIIDAGTGGTDFATITNGTFGDGIFTTSVGAGGDAGDIFLNYSIAIPGDFNGDGNVDGDDFATWQMNFPTASGAFTEDGDADGDGDVDGADFVVWQINFSSGGGASLVPEPHTLILVGIGGLFVLASRRSKIRLK
jgi:autotransporter-associated beta strand protein